jgi:23S rRNA (guanosine2251-2'-O)-methyltransferase
MNFDNNIEHIVYGLHAVEAVLDNPFRTVFSLYINQERKDKRLEKLLTNAKLKGIAVIDMKPQTMKQNFSKINHQGVIAHVSKLPNFTEQDLDALLDLNTRPLLILILDGVTDPHNLGACLRSADAVGVNFVIIPKDNSAPITAVVNKVACGATETVPLIRVTNLARTMERLKQAGVWLYGAAGEAETSLYALNTTGHLGIVLGAEGTGLRRLTREHCDGLFSIPMQGSVSSLNVSVATGVCLYEVLRQRNQL